MLVLLLLAAFGLPGVAWGQDAATSLHALLEEAWAYRLQEDPLYATYVGEHAYDALLPSVTAADQERRAETWRAFLERLQAIDRGALGLEDQISHAIFETQLEGSLAGVAYGAYRIPLTSDGGFHIGFTWVPDQMPFATVGDYENYLARLRAWPGYVQQHIDLMREGMETGMTMPRPPLEGYEVTVASHVVEAPDASLFFAPFDAFPSSLPENEKVRLREEGGKVIMEYLVPGYRAFLDFMVNEYFPAARTSTGARDLPSGEAYYAHLVRHFTTLDISPEAVHEIGLSEVARIRAEMQVVIEEVSFEGSFGDFLTFLRTDPQFYATTPEAYLQEAAWIAKRMDGQLPKLFKTLPRLPYGLAPVPDHLAPKYTGGRYIEPAAGGREAGWYWLNTYKLESRPRYILEALTFHEAVPGHHLQIALAQELDHLPPFRRALSLTAYEEGWGLYAEWLGQEAGFYRDPYSRFGRLTYEMWRACRLVVDTGLHAFGWTRQQAINYLASHTALSLHEVTTEIDRYISWPGQALGYKMGELTIRRLREEAEAALGERFDVRDFHDVILLHGEVPLTVMEDLVRRYIAETLAGE